MPQALLILELLLRYGPALARAAIEMVNRKDPPTIAEWDAVFALTEEPYGLTPDAGILALGKVPSIAGTSATWKPFPSGIDAGAIIIVKAYPAAGDREVWCNEKDDCFVVKRSAMIQAGGYWVAQDGTRFFLNL